MPKVKRVSINALNKNKFKLTVTENDIVHNALRDAKLLRDEAYTIIKKIKDLIQGK